MWIIKPVPLLGGWTTPIQDSEPLAYLVTTVYGDWVRGQVVYFLELMAQPRFPALQQTSSHPSHPSNVE